MLEARARDLRWARNVTKIELPGRHQNPSSYDRMIKVYERSIVNVEYCLIVYSIRLAGGSSIGDIDDI